MKNAVTRRRRAAKRLAAAGVVVLLPVVFAVRSPAAGDADLFQKDPRNEKAILEKSFVEVDEALGRLEFSDVRRVLRTIHHRLDGLRPHLSRQERKSYEQRVGSIEQTMAAKEDSLVGVTVEVLKREGREAAIEHLQQVLRRLRVSEEKVRRAEEAIMSVVVPSRQEIVLEQARAAIRKGRPIADIQDLEVREVAGRLMQARIDSLRAQQSASRRQDAQTRESRERERQKMEETRRAEEERVERERESARLAAARVENERRRQEKAAELERERREEADRRRRAEEARVERERESARQAAARAEDERRRQEKAAELERERREEADRRRRAEEARVERERESARLAAARAEDERRRQEKAAELERERRGRATDEERGRTAVSGSFPAEMAVSGTSGDGVGSSGEPMMSEEDILRLSRKPRVSDAERSRQAMKAREDRERREKKQREEAERSERGRIREMKRLHREEEERINRLAELKKQEILAARFSQPLPDGSTGTPSEMGDGERARAYTESIYEMLEQNLVETAYRTFRRNRRGIRRSSTKQEYRALKNTVDVLYKEMTRARETNR